MIQEESMDQSNERPKLDPLGWDYDGLPTPVVDGPAVRTLERNERGRDLIVGDVHAQRATFERLLEIVNYDPAGGDRLLLLGDLIDRGPDSAGMLQWLQRDGVYCIRGNHEQMMLDALNGDRHIHELWTEHNGGMWSLGLTPEQRNAWRVALRPLPMALEVDTAGGKVVLAHAEIPVETPWWAFRSWLEEGDRIAGIRVLWNRVRVFSEQEDAGVPDAWRTYHGHTPLKRPKQIANMFWIDTGAAYPDRFDGAAISCVAIEPNGIVQEPVQALVNETPPANAEEEG